jgi:uncharacterized protein YkwD
VAYRTASAVKLASITAAVAIATWLAPSAVAVTAAGETATSRSLVNTARRDADLASLPVDLPLQRIAQDQSERMAAQGSIFHNTHLGDAVSAAGIDWRWVGENVGVGPDAKLIHGAFMNSPHHREVLLHPDGNAFGIGAAIGKDGRLYITQVYAKIVPSRPVAEGHPVRAAPKARPVARPPAPRTVGAPSDPNALIHGVVPHDVFGVTPRGARGWNVTRSGLPAS